MDKLPSLANAYIVESGRASKLVAVQNKHEMRKYSSSTLSPMPPPPSDVPQIQEMAREGRYHEDSRKLYAYAESIGVAAELDGGCAMYSMHFLGCLVGFGWTFIFPEGCFFQCGTFFCCMNPVCCWFYNPREAVYELCNLRCDGIKCHMVKVDEDRDTMACLCVDFCDCNRECNCWDPVQWLYCYRIGASKETQSISKEQGHTKGGNSSFEVPHSDSKRTISTQSFAPST